MSQLNFIRNRWERLQLIYVAIDISFICLTAFIMMFSLSMILSYSGEENRRVEKYIQSQINKLKAQTSKYNEIKNYRDELVNLSSAWTNIKTSQNCILIDMEKISKAVTKNLYVTNINYVTNNIIINGESKDLKLLAVFITNLEIQFKTKKN